MLLDCPWNRSTWSRRHRDTNGLVRGTSLMVNASTAPIKQSTATALADEEDFLCCTIICTTRGQNELYLWGDFINSWCVGWGGCWCSYCRWLMIVDCRRRWRWRHDNSKQHQVVVGWMVNGEWLLSVVCGIGDRRSKIEDAKGRSFVAPRGFLQIKNWDSFELSINNTSYIHDIWIQASQNSYCFPHMWDISFLW